MGDGYRVSSSVRVEQMEAELSQQVSALQEQIEENDTRTFKYYSSVLPPRAISFLRAERERALKIGLQVNEYFPVQSAADVMQKELESCLSLENTPDNLPLLLHQFYTDRAYHLAQVKYIFMLRWRRFCRHTSVIEELYPVYKDQVSYINCEHEDSVQRARRLSASREMILTDQADVASLLTQEDVMIYLRWLICHLHSVRPIQNFLRVLHYIPTCERKDKTFQEEESSSQTQHGDGALVRVETVPQHSVHLKDLLPELQSLLTYFHLPYDTGKLMTTADEMELFSLVWREFRKIFQQQEQRRTFPQYDSTQMEESQWGRKSGGMALRKEANWIPFIQVKPRRDPWQQKQRTRMKEKKCVDELMKMHSSFLQVPDLLQVASALKEHGARVCHPQSTSMSTVSHMNMKTKGGKISDIWTSVYSGVSLTQDTPLCSSTCTGGDEESSKNQSLEILGLDDCLEDQLSNPVVTRGAYLSLIYLRHLKLRELKRVSLGILNYFRSVERTLTFDLAGVRLEDGELCSTAEETGWMNAARGGSGEAGGLGSLQFIHNTPVDYKVHCSEFMDFPEVANLHDFYSTEENSIHTQDHRGFFIVYDVALKDLDKLENELLLLGSHFIRKKTLQKFEKGEQQSPSTAKSDINSWAGTDVDRVAVLLDLWTWETEFLESKVQLLNCYYEAYQHSAGLEERFALARVITDIMHSRPQMDLEQEYFIQVYRAEVDCLRSHQQLIKGILDNQIEYQRLFLQHIRRSDDRGSFYDFGLPLNFTPKYTASLGGSGPSLMSVFLLELHPSLCLASSVYQGILQAHSELCQLHQATRALDKLFLRQKLLQEALQNWRNLASPGASYSPQIQKNLFSDVFFGNPYLVQNVGLSLVQSEVDNKNLNQERERQSFTIDTFSKLQELVIIRHRLLESASETEHLAQLYRNIAAELGLEEFHLYLRPVQFEEQTEERSIFMTSMSEDNSLEKFIPSYLPLSIHELDEEHIGRFSFSSEDAVIRLMNTEGIENLQVTLASQVVQKNALISAVDLVCLCYWAESVSSQTESEECLHSSIEVKSVTRCDSKTGNTSSIENINTSSQRLVQAFVSIQLEKAGLRDKMLDSFMKQKEAEGDCLENTEEAAKIKRSLIVKFLRTFNQQMSQYCVRAQIISYYFSLMSLLNNIPSIRQSHFMTGKEKKTTSLLDLGDKIIPDPSASQDHQDQGKQFMSADGSALLNLWIVPHFSEVLQIFKTLKPSDCATALHHTLHIASALHDIVCYLVSFSRLGNAENTWSGRRDQPETESRLVAEWGGSEGIGVELLEIQRQVELLSEPSSPDSVAQLLQLRRQVLLLQFDTAVRVLIREAFLSSGDVMSYQSVSDNMATALPLLGDSVHTDVFTVSLPVPQPLQTHRSQAQTMYPWRSFVASHGLFPLKLWVIPAIEYSMQLCLCDLKDSSRLQANAAILGVSLLMEDVLNSGGEAQPVRLHGSKDDLLQDEKTLEERKSNLTTKVEREMRSNSTASLQDPVQVQSVLKGFLLTTKQLQVFKESWACRHFGSEVFSLPTLYQQFISLYRAEIFLPSMKALAQQVGKGRDYELLISGRQTFLPPPGASEADVKAWQLHRLLEVTECDMIKAVQRRINRELSLVVSEKTRRDTCLPTDLWKKAPLKHRLSLERPQIVEIFIKQLMDGAEQKDGQVKISEDHLRRCVAHLGALVMERERRSFLLYSQFYEQILQQNQKLLYQREQDLKATDVKKQKRNRLQEASGSCRHMMLEISALQARVAHLEDEKHSLEEKLCLKFKEHYDHVVRQLVSTCVQLKAKLDEHPLQMEQDVSVLVNTVRGEGVERLVQIKNKYGCTKDNWDLTVTQLKKVELHDLSLENSQLTSLLCKLKALSRWKQTVDQEKLHRQLLQTQQREISSRSDALRVKMVAEEEVLLLQEELDAVRQMLSSCQAECSRTKKLLSKKSEELQMARHQSAKEARSRQELDTYRAKSLEQMRVDVEDRDRQLRALSEQLDRGSKMSQFQRQRSAKKIRQVKGQLHQERSLKQEAFQQVEKLQNQVVDMEETFSRNSSAAVQSRSGYRLSASRWSCSRSPSASLQRLSQQLRSLTSDSTTLLDPASERRHLRAATDQSRSNTRIDRQRAEPSQLHVLTPQRLLPEL